MILRRFMKHVTDQNWFAVGLDVIVVIVGIFLGLQVQEWNEQRGERLKEKVFIDRLHLEVMNGLGYRDKNIRSVIFGEQLQEIQKHLIDIMDVWSGIKEKDLLNKEHCTAIMASHIYVDPTITLPTMTELISSGQISLLRNENFKRAFSEYSLASETQMTLVDHFNSVSLVLHRKYPDLIALDPKMGASVVLDLDNVAHQCDFEKMERNVAFKNDLIDNATKLTNFVFTYQELFGRLEAIHEILDDELGITHD